MTANATGSTRPPRRLLRSTVAVISGLIAVVAPSVGTDLLMSQIGVFPPSDQPMHSAGQFLIALGYRSAYAVFGSWIAATLSPRTPMRHALILGVIGLALNLAGLAVEIMTPDLGPMWYPTALVLTALPCAWLGGALSSTVRAVA